MFIRQLCSTLQEQPGVRGHPLFSFTGSGRHTQKLSNYPQHVVTECFITASLAKEETFNLTFHSSCWDANKGPKSLSEEVTQTMKVRVLGDSVFKHCHYCSEFKCETTQFCFWSLLLL